MGDLAGNPGFPLPLFDKSSQRHGNFEFFSLNSETPGTSNFFAIHSEKPGKFSNPVNFVDSELTLQNHSFV